MKIEGKVSDGEKCLIFGINEAFAFEVDQCRGSIRIQVYAHGVPMHSIRLRPGESRMVATTLGPFVLSAGDGMYYTIEYEEP